MLTPGRIIGIAVVMAGVLVGGFVLYSRAWKRVPPPPPPDGQTLSLDMGGGVMMEFVRIEPGEFEMGSADTEEGHDPSEAPRHRAKIGKAFFIGKYEVTQGQWQAVMNYNQAQLKGDAKQAVDSVGWVDAQKFCKYAGERTGRVMRLPTEAEWEYACRAGTTTAFAFGEKLTPADAVFNWSKVDEAAGKPDRPGLVGSKKANAWGVYDMHGNLWEWCQDAFEPDYSRHPATQGAVMAKATGEPDYAYRGGSWRSSAEECRSAVRFAGAGELRSDVMGMRVVVEVR